MASEDAHIRLAVRNQSTINHLRQDGAAFSEWITTVAFYKALHLVEAIFARDSGVKHGTGHDDRARRLKQQRKYTHLWANYRPLWAASTVARYLQDTIGRTGDYASFADYLTPQQVEDVVLKHHLHQVEQTARGFLSADSVQALALQPPKPRKQGS